MSANSVWVLSACVAVTLLVAAPSALAQETAPVNVDRLKGIYAGPAPSPIEKDAATLLRTSLKRLYGIDVPETAGLDGVGPDGAAIVLGRAATVAAGLVKEDEIAQAGPGAFLTRCGGSRIAIAGEDVWGTYFGVLGFLEKLGIRFYLSDPAKAYVPGAPPRMIAPFSVIDRPAFAFRNGWNLLGRLTHRALGDPHNGLNPELFDPKRTKSDLWVDHTSGYLVPKLLYYETHPEYYALGEDGKRVAKDSFSDHRTPLCLSNPDVARVAVERAIGWIERNPQQRFFNITYGDTGVWCQCPECRKLDPAPGEYATRLLHWVNPVARAVREKHPDKILMTFAYGGSDKVPPVARPERNVRVVVATGCGNFPFWAHAYAQGLEALRANTRKIEEWTAIAPGQVMVCEYLGEYEPAMVDKVADRLRYYQKIGLQGIFATYGAPANFRPVWEYAWSKMCWNPQQDGQALAKEFIRFRYGPAAEPIARFFDLSHARYQATLASKEKLSDGNYPPSYYSPEFARQSLACFDEAVKAAAADAALKKELQTEECLFLRDLAAHLPAYDLSEPSNRQLLEYLDRQRTLARETGGEVAFIRDTQYLALGLEKKRPGYRDLLGKWLGAATEMQPAKTANGLHFTPEMFLWGDYGPDLFPQAGCQSHPKFPCPPKACVGVLAKGTDSRGKSSNTRMQTTFALDAVPGDGSASLDIEGQDAIRYWGLPHEFGMIAHIAISVNGKKVFTGPCGLVRGNWSRRTFAIPPGLLRAGRNTLEIRNVTPEAPGFSPFRVCWFLLSDAALIFGGGQQGQ